MEGSRQAGTLSSSLHSATTRTLLSSPSRTRSITPPVGYSSFLIGSRAKPCAPPSRNMRPGGRSPRESSHEAQSPCRRWSLRNCLTRMEGGTTRVPWIFQSWSLLVPTLVPIKKAFSTHNHLQLWGPAALLLTYGQDNVALNDDQAEAFSNLLQEVAVNRGYQEAMGMQGAIDIFD